MKETSTMWRFFFPPTPKTTIKPSRNRCFRPRVEVLEDRYCPSGAGLEWADPFGIGGPGDDWGGSVAADSAGNVYVSGGIGSSYGHYAPTPVDFDPSSGV